MQKKKSFSFHLTLHLAHFLHLIRWNLKAPLICTEAPYICIEAPLICIEAPLVCIEAPLVCIEAPLIFMEPPQGANPRVLIVCLSPNNRSPILKQLRAYTQKQ